MKRYEINSFFANDKGLGHFIEGLPASFLDGGQLLWDGRNKIRAYDNVLQGKTEGVGRMVVKRFKHLAPVQKMVYAIRCHKAQKAFRNGLELTKRGFKTPVPLAFVEIRRGLWLTDAYYISGSTGLHCIEDHTDRDDWDRELATALARFVASLHEHGVLHHDLNDTNVLFERDETGTYHFELIDINRMKFYPDGAKISIGKCIENLTRFTGRTDLFEYVIREYAKVRNLDEEAMALRSVAQKLRHDQRWRRRKRISHIFKHRKKH